MDTTPSAEQWIKAAEMTGKKYGAHSGHAASSSHPDDVHLPGIYVKRMIVGAPYDKKIEFRLTRPRPEASAAAAGSEV